MVLDSDSRQFCRRDKNTDTDKGINSKHLGNSIDDVVQGTNDLSIKRRVHDDNSKSTTVDHAGNRGAAVPHPVMGVGASSSNAWVTGVPSVDSGYLQQSALGISHHTHWDLPALMTAIQYFTQCEVRGVAEWFLPAPIYDAFDLIKLVLNCINAFGNISKTTYRKL